MESNKFWNFVQYNQSYPTKKEEKKKKKKKNEQFVPKLDRSNEIEE